MRQQSEQSDVESMVRTINDILSTLAKQQQIENQIENKVFFERSQVINSVRILHRHRQMAVKEIYET